MLPGLYLSHVRDLSHLKINNIFQVPAVPKKAVPEEKVPVPVPKKAVAPPAKGTPAFSDSARGFLNRSETGARWSCEPAASDKEKVNLAKFHRNVLLCVKTNAEY